MSNKVHRRLVVPPHWHDSGDHLQKGGDVLAFQKACNARIKNLKLPIRPLELDGECGRQTVATGRRVARHLGIGLRKGVYGVQPYVQHLIRCPDERNKAQKRRGEKYREKHHEAPGVKVNGNKVTGGTPQERFLAAQRAACDGYYRGTRTPVQYSQAGVTTFDKAITGEPYGHRTDCSQIQVGFCWSAHVKDPCGSDFDPAQAHYTGSLWYGCTRVRREDLRPGGFILYGSHPTYHHVEGYHGDGNPDHKWSQMSADVRDRTIGHGSPPVDWGDIDMMAGPTFWNCNHKERT